MSNRKATTKLICTIEEFVDVVRVSTFGCCGLTTIIGNPEKDPEDIAMLTSIGSLSLMIDLTRYQTNTPPHEVSQLASSSTD